MEQNQLIEQPIGEFAELYNFRDPDTAIFKTDVGLTEDVVRKISELKGEPEWMLEFRLKALAHFFEKPMPALLPADSRILQKQHYHRINPPLKMP